MCELSLSMLIINNIILMDNVDLLELRQKLHSYKKTGMKSVMKILDYLDNNDVDAK